MNIELLLFRSFSFRYSLTAKNRSFLFVICFVRIVRKSNFCIESFQIISKAYSHRQVAPFLQGLHVHVVNEIQVLFFCKFSVRIIREIND